MAEMRQYTPDEFKDSKKIDPTEDNTYYVPEDLRSNERGTTVKLTKKQEEDAEATRQDLVDRLKSSF